MKLFFRYLILLTVLVYSQITYANEQLNKTNSLEIATFAGGCFWCMEPPFDKIEGVSKTISGYTGGATKNPTYKQVTQGSTGHREAVQVTFDPTLVSYENLLSVFWKNIDPTQNNGQFCDKGYSYTTAIYAHNEQQRNLAQASIKQLNETKNFKQPIVTKIVKASEFYPAEEYHQDYYLKNPYRYKFYRFQCGRDQRLKELWGAK